MKKISNKNIYVKNPETGDYESIVGFQGESAYDAAVRLGKTNLSEEKWVAEYVEKRNEAIEAIDNEGEAVLQTLPDDYIKMSSDVRQKATVISNKQSGQLIHIPNGSPQQVLSSITHVEVMQSGSGDPSTNNVRPIIGWDAIRLNRASDNVLGFDTKKTLTYTNGVTVTTIAGTSEMIINGTATGSNASNYLVTNFDLPAGTYTFAIEGLYGTDYVNIGRQDGVGTDFVWSMQSSTKDWTFTLEKTETIKVGMIIRNGSVYNNTKAWIRCTPGDKLGESNVYTPIKGLTASLPETLYGFDINWTTGLVTVNEEIISYNGTENWTVGSLSNTVRLAKPQNAASAVCCSHYKVAPMSSLYDSVNVVTQVNFHDSVYTVDVATWKAYLAAQAAAGTPVTVAYKLSTPTTIQLTPQQMETLKGTNNIWSNVGETEVVYVLDTKEYVDAVDVSKASVILENTSGNVITISDHIEDFPLKSLITTVVPKQEGSGDPSPDNVRPISGWNEVNVNRAGKNLLPEGTMSFVTKHSVYFNPPLPPGTYTISGLVTSDDADDTVSGVYYYNNSVSLTKSNFNRGVKEIKVLTFEKEVDMIVFFSSRLNSTSVGDACQWEEVQLEVGETATTTYEPYQGQTLTAELPETVYGGYHNWTNGEQGKTKRLYQFTGEENITHSSSALSFHVTRKDNPIVRLTGAEYDQKRKNVECSHFIGKSYIEWVEGCVSLYYGTNGETIGFKTSAFPDVAAFTAFLREQYNAGTPVTVVFDLLPEYWELLTPGVPQQLETLKGTNNIWSDAGATEVTYAADTKMYADGKDSTAMIGTAEPGMIATKNYTSGSFIVVGKNLYKATAAIATGETIAPGTNCTATTVVEQLEAIYQLLNT